MDRATGIFVDGIGAASATSGVLSQLQGRIFAILYLQREPLTLEDIASELQQSKSNISVNIRGLVEWHLVRQVRVAGSRKDHYEAVSNFWRAMQEIMERRFRWTVRQVLAAVTETDRALAQEAERQEIDPQYAKFLGERFAALRMYFAAVDAVIGAFTQGKTVDAETLQSVIPLATSPSRPLP